jgi:hypothetical protein
MFERVIKLFPRMSLWSSKKKLLFGSDEESDQTTSSPVASRTVTTTSSSSSASTSVARATAPTSRGVAKKKVVAAKKKKSMIPNTGQWLSRRRSITSPFIGPTIEGPAIRLRPKIVTPSQDDVHYERLLIDLTQDSHIQELLPGAKLSTIKSRHELYFSYNPRGETDIDCRYCPKCRCPKNYCSTLVFGDVVQRRVKSHIKRLGLDHPDLNYRMVQILFNKYYSKQMNFKVLENGYEEEKGYSGSEAYYKIPGCMESLRDETAEEILQEAGEAGKKRKVPTFV